MSFLFMRGLVRGVYRTPEGKTREGRDYGGKDVIDLEVEMPLANGAVKREILHLNTGNPDRYEPDAVAEVPVGYFVKNGSVIWFEAKATEGRK